MQKTETDIVKIRLGDWSEGAYHSFVVGSSSPEFRAGELAQTLAEFKEKYSDDISSFFVGAKLSVSARRFLQAICVPFTIGDYTAETAAELLIAIANRLNPKLGLYQIREVRRTVLDTTFAFSVLGNVANTSHTL